MKLDYGSIMSRLNHVYRAMNSRLKPEALQGLKIFTCPPEMSRRGVWAVEIPLKNSPFHLNISAHSPCTPVFCVKQSPDCTGAESLRREWYRSLTSAQRHVPCTHPQHLCTYMPCTQPPRKKQSRKRSTYECRTNGHSSAGVRTGTHTWATAKKMVPEELKKVADVACLVEISWNNSKIALDVFQRYICETEESWLRMMTRRCSSPAWRDA